ncbi:MAG: hypothetical protein P8X58_15605, partial [Syntrophobacterales bacterium]
IAAAFFASLFYYHYEPANSRGFYPNFPAGELTVGQTGPICVNGDRLFLLGLFSLNMVLPF